VSTFEDAPGAPVPVAARAVNRGCAMVHGTNMRVSRPELSGGAPTPAPDRAARPTRPALVVFVLVELVAGGVYLWFARGMWFSADEWDFLVSRRAGDLGDIFRQHTEHLVALPVLTYRLMWELFGLRSYLPYQLLIVSLHLVAALLLRAVMRRAGVRPWIATAVGLLFVCFGAGNYDIVYPFQITLVGSLVFGLSHLLVADHGGPVDRRDAIGLGLGLVGLLCSGLAVAMVLAVGVATLLRRGWRVAMLHVVPLGVVYAVWWIVIGHQEPTPIPSLADAARFGTHMFGATVSAVGQVPGLGVVLVVITAVGLATAAYSSRGPVWRTTLTMPVALGAGMIVFVVTATTRSDIYSPTSSRYLYVVTALALPAMGVAVEAIVQRRRQLLVPLCVLFLLGVPGNLRTFVDYTNSGPVKSMKEYRRMVLGSAHLAVATQDPPDVRPDHVLAKQSDRVTIGWLRSGVASGRVPALAHLSAAEIAMDTLRLSLVPAEPPRVAQKCVPVGGGVLVELTPHHTIRTIGLQRLEVLPPTTSAHGTDPFLLDGGSSLHTLRPIDFRLVYAIASPRDNSEVCGTPTAIRSDPT
jgi:hypothetical protein